MKNFLITALLTAAVSANAAPNVKLGSVSGDAGSSVIVPMTLTSNGFNSCAIEYTINYDSTRLEYQSVSTGSAASSAGKEAHASNAAPGTIKISVFGINSNAIPDGVVANLTFRIKNGASGVATLNGQCGVTDGIGTPATSGCGSGTVSINGDQTLSCTSNSTTACMLNGRFRVTVRYRGAFDNGAVNTNASVKSVSGFANPSFETAFFYFNSENNIELLVKILDQGNTNAQGQATIAVLFGTATPLRVELSITDTLKGTQKTYTSAFNSMQGGTDFTAFVK